MLWLVVVVLWLDQVPPQARWNAIGTGALLVALTLPKGKTRKSYGAFDPYIF